MQHIYLLTLLYFSLSVCYGQSSWYGQLGKKYASIIEEHRKALNHCYQEAIYAKAIESTEEQRIQTEQQFFKVFTDGFGFFGDIYTGWDLSWTKERHFRFFYELRYVDKESYYNKYLDLIVSCGYLPSYSSCYGPLGDTAAAMEIRKRGYNKLSNNIEPALEALSKRPKSEIIAFFLMVVEDCIYELPESVRDISLYNRLRSKVIELTPSIYQIAEVKALLDKAAKREERVDPLIKSYVKALNCTEEERGQYEQIFFDAFPCSFAEMEEIYGSLGPLCGVEEHINFFASLKTIDKELYYTKYINICIGGVYDADCIRNGFGISSKLYHDTKEMTRLFAKRTDEEVKSVFRFIFDEPHPDSEGNKEAYKRLYPKIKKVNPKMARLLKQAYERLLAEGGGCRGH